MCTCFYFRVLHASSGPATGSPAHFTQENSSEGQCGKTCSIRWWVITLCVWEALWWLCLSVMLLVAPMGAVSGGGGWIPSGTAIWTNYARHNEDYFVCWHMHTHII